MITNEDLNKIGKLINNSLDNKLKPVRNDLSKLSKSQNQLNSKVSRIEDDITKIRIDQKTIINFFDNAYLDLRTRIESIEKFLKLPGLPTIN